MVGTIKTHSTNSNFGNNKVVTIIVLAETIIVPANYYETRSVVLYDVNLMQYCPNRYKLTSSGGDEQKRVIP